ncbi:MAG: YbaB/EbfC family nucleoid-associated protein [Gammaproteobacteria bacterium]|jgi:DNA-binding YbaB/EbfC family protein
MKGPLGNIMKQAQRMQEDMERAQAELAAMEVVGEAGGGMVRVTMLGNRDVKAVKIDPALIGDDITLIEDLAAAAMNDASRKIEALTKEKMSGLTAGLNLPPGFKLPF